LERKLADSQRRADEHLAELTARKEQLKASRSRKEAREARQAAVEVRKRRAVTERDLHYREARLVKMQQLRDKVEAEQKIRDKDASLMEKVQVSKHQLRPKSITPVCLLQVRNKSATSP